jgi:hypothetical protein
MIDKFVKETFLKLTSRTYPYGFEKELLHLLPDNIKPDKYGNYYLNIGNTKTIFACHLDTACKDFSNVTHQFIEQDGVNYITTDGKTILGADDKAGVTILLWMIENKIPGLYYFFTGEEVGCIGSGLASKDQFFKNYNRIISFDRRGTNSVITHQSYTRTCSDLFANSLVKELNKNNLLYKTDDNGVYTDSAEFTKIISECTNISVGYYKEHTFFEHQNIDHLIALCKAVININWDSLPASRDVNKTEFKNWSWDGYEAGWDDDTDFTRPINSWKKTRRSDKKYKGTYAGKYPEQYKKDEEEFIASHVIGKNYYDNIDNQMVRTGKNKFVLKSDYNNHDDFYSNKNEYYTLLKDKYFSNDLTKEELDIVKEQYKH